MFSVLKQSRKNVSIYETKWRNKFKILKQSEEKCFQLWNEVKKTMFPIMKQSEEDCFKFLKQCEEHCFKFLIQCEESCFQFWNTVREVQTVYTVNCRSLCIIVIDVLWSSNFHIVYQDIDPVITECMWLDTLG